MAREAHGLSLEALIPESAIDESLQTGSDTHLVGCLEYDRYMSFVYGDESPITTAKIVALGIVSGEGVGISKSSEFSLAPPEVTVLQDISPAPGKGVIYYCAQLELGSATPDRDSAAQ